MKKKRIKSNQSVFFFFQLFLFCGAKFTIFQQKQKHNKKKSEVFTFDTTKQDL